MFVCIIVQNSDLQDVHKYLHRDQQNCINESVTQHVQRASKSRLVVDSCLFVFVVCCAVVSSQMMKLVSC